MGYSKRKAKARCQATPDIAGPPDSNKPLKPKEVSNPPVIAEIQEDGVEAEIRLLAAYTCAFSYTRASFNFHLLSRGYRSASHVHLGRQGERNWRVRAKVG